MTSLHPIVNINSKDSILSQVAGLQRALKETSPPHDLLCKMFEEIHTSKDKLTQSYLTFFFENENYFVALNGKNNLFLLKEIKCIGNGYFGTAFKVHDCFTNTQMCLKIAKSNDNVLNDHKMLQRANSPKSPILGIQEGPALDADETFTERLGLLSPLYDGDYLQLKEYIFKDSILDRVDVTIQLLLGLNHLINKNIEHLDLHNKNIFVTVEPISARIGDFGNSSEKLKKDKVIASKMIWFLYTRVLRDLWKEDNFYSKREKSIGANINLLIFKYKKKPEQIEELISKIEKCVVISKENLPTYQAVILAEETIRFVQVLITSSERVSSLPNPRSLTEKMLALAFQSLIRRTLAKL